MKTARRRLRSVPGRAAKRDAKLEAVGVSMLAQAETLLKRSSELDTAVRDTVANGLAYLVYAAYDTIAVAQLVSEFDMGPFIAQKTYEWFRERGFVEWFCAGASTLFRTQPRYFYRTKVSKARSGKAVVFSREKVG